MPDDPTDRRRCEVRRKEPGAALGVSGLGYCRDMR
jgi:hypothetical protein